MEDAKKHRTSKARIVTRRMNEVLNGIKSISLPGELNEKIHTLKNTMEELGKLQDEVILLIDESDQTTLETEENWYYEYDRKVNTAIKQGMIYIKDNTKPPDVNPVTQSYVKLRKLEVPSFSSDRRNYLKWKVQFKRYTKHLDVETKYDYLFNYTKGDAHLIVCSKQNYPDAIGNLDKEFGNTHLIMKLLIDDIRNLHVVKKGDHKTFEILSREVNGFRDRLNLMSKEAEVENTYILQEIENKLNNEDKQKWLEYMGNKVDERKVKDICNWLEKQAYLRRLTGHQSSKFEPNDTWNPYNRPKSVMTNPSKPEINNVCPLCNYEQHSMQECPKFIQSSNEERWNHVKKLYLCFICLSPGHRSFECRSTKCDICHRAHNNLLHRWDKVRKEENVYDGNKKGNQKVEVTGSPTSCYTERTYKSNVYKTEQTDYPTRAFLPIVQSKLKSDNNSTFGTTLLDTGSEINIVSKRMAKYLGLIGRPIVINTVGVGAVLSQQVTEKVEFLVEDLMGKEVYIEAIVLERACGRALPIPVEIIEEVNRKCQINTERLYTGGGEIDLLIGMGCPHLHRQTGIYGDPHGISIMETRFGPCLVGPAPLYSNGNYESSVFNVHFVSISKEVDLWRFIEAETAGIMKDCPCQLKTDDEIKYEKAMENAWTTDLTGRLEVKLPWKVNPSTLPNIRVQALHRDANLKRQLARKPEVEKLFS